MGQEGGTGQKMLQIQRYGRKSAATAFRLQNQYDRRAGREPRSQASFGADKNVAAQDTAEDYINIHKTFGNSDHGPNLSLPMRSLRLLAAPSTRFHA
jgi:hypothetical protein